MVSETSPFVKLYHWKYSLVKGRTPKSTFSCDVLMLVLDLTQMNVRVHTVTLIFSGGSDKRFRLKWVKHNNQSEECNNSTGPFTSENEETHSGFCRGWS